MIVVSSGGRTSKKKLNYAYKLWVAEEGGESLTPAAITKRIKSLNYEEGWSSQGRFWRDITLLEELDVLEKEF